MKKFDYTEIGKYKFHQHKSVFSIDNIDLNNVLVSHKVCFSKKDFKYLIGYKDTKKIDLYTYSFQQWVHIEKIFIKLDDKRWKMKIVGKI